MSVLSDLEAHLDGAWRHEPHKLAKAKNAISYLKAHLAELTALGINLNLTADAVVVPPTNAQIAEQEAQAKPEPEPEAETNLAGEDDDTKRKPDPSADSGPDAAQNGGTL